LLRFDCSHNEFRPVFSALRQGSCPCLRVWSIKCSRAARDLGEHIGGVLASGHCQRLQRPEMCGTLSYISPLERGLDLVTPINRALDRMNCSDMRDLVLPHFYAPVTSGDSLARTITKGALTLLEVLNTDWYYSPEALVPVMDAVADGGCLS